MENPSVYQIGDDRYLVIGFCLSETHLRFEIELIDNTAHIVKKNVTYFTWNRHAISALQMAMLEDTVVAITPEQLNCVVMAYLKYERTAPRYYPDWHQQIINWLKIGRNNDAFGLRGTPIEYLQFLAICIEREIRARDQEKAAETRAYKKAHQPDTRQGSFDFPS